MPYFPLALAGGSAFCNRFDEQKKLRGDLLESKPTLIVSPRCYGENSLALQSIDKTKLYHAQFDFLSVVDAMILKKLSLKELGNY